MNKHFDLLWVVFLYLKSFCSPTPAIADSGLPCPPGRTDEGTSRSRRSNWMFALNPTSLLHGGQWAVGFLPLTRLLHTGNGETTTGTAATLPKRCKSGLRSQGQDCK